MRQEQIRTYHRASSVVFLKTDAPFGGLSNMAGGFTLRVNGVRILTSEALYQACRFPHRPEVQALIIGQKSPMTAKMKSKPYRNDSRPDWDQVRVKIMRWCLRVKLAQNWRAFGELLLETGERPIVEESRKDNFWGAKAADDGLLVGVNVLGRLLMELREMVKEDSRESLMLVQPLAIPDFLLGGQPIGVVADQDVECDVALGQVAAKPARTDAGDQVATQPSLFDGPTVKEASPPSRLGEIAQGVRVANLTPYAAYKESGLPWLGQVPRHWGLVPNRGLVRKRKMLVGKRHGDYRLLSLTKQGVIVRDISTGKGKFSADMGTSQEVRRGDFVFCLFDVPETPRTVGLSRHDGMITGAYTVLESLGSGSPEYFELFYQAMDDRKLLSPLYSGLRNTIPTDRFLGTKTPQPPPDEQAAIVRFLDWANERLERTIRAKRKVIALLNEQKQAIIHSAVTRGLDPSVPFKPSGILWLGDIPRHWEVRRLRASITDCVNGVWGADPDGETDLTCVRVADFDRRSLRVSVKRKTTRAIPLSLRVRRLLQAGDLLLEKSGGGERQPVGAVVLYVSDEPAVCSNFVARMPVAAGYHSGFLNYLHSALYTLRMTVPSIKQTTGIQNLDAKSYLAERAAFPDQNEQAAISLFLDNESVRFNQAISRLEREIGFLREYRTRLVADVVTGKLDVREAAARLPNEASLDTHEDDGEVGDEPEATDEETVA